MQVKEYSLVKPNMTEFDWKDRIFENRIPQSRILSFSIWNVGA